jgi:hypothetical protein
MRTESVEIYSDETNAAVLRHPSRKFPGVLVQGDTLYGLSQRADQLCSDLRDKLSSREFADLSQLRNSLWSLLTHYKVVLGEHDIPLPFSER